MFEECDGAPIRTHSSLLLPVSTADGTLAMLKLALVDEERRGAVLLSWWDGDGAARVLAADGDALLLERAVGARDLAEMCRSGPDGDDAASRIICAVADRLHAPRVHPPPPTLVPLERWFAELWPAAATHGGALARCASLARELLDDPQDACVLHGDLHHGNVLDFGVRGWLAIDPKGLYGERGFDYANILCNPDSAVTTAPGRLARQAEVVAAAARLDRARLLRWVAAYAGLSAAWTLGEGGDAALALTVAQIALAELRAEE